VLIKRALLAAALFAVACDNSPSEPTVTPGLYRLVSVNGQPVPWVSPPSTGFLEHFVDEVFYRRHRYQSNAAYNATGGEISFSSVEWTNFGAHDTIGGRVVIRAYSRPFPAHPTGDTLSIVGNDLVRRSQLISGLREDRYVRQ
jgi:hypothetical protein